MKDSHALIVWRGLIRAILTAPRTGMFFARAKMELLGDYAAVSPGFVRPGHCGDRAGHPHAEDDAQQQCPHHWGGPPPGQVATGVPRHPHDATTNLSHPHVSPPRVRCAAGTVDYPAGNY
jgi:hypothetical protein